MKHDGIRSYQLPLVESFQRAAKSHPLISVDADVMAGAPCVKGTRIPVYGILDSVRHGGSLVNPFREWPRLTLEQVEQALRFAAEVIECPIEDDEG